MHLRSFDELKRQFMSGKIDVMREDWLILDGVNVRGKMHHLESSGTLLSTSWISWSTYFLQKF